MNISAVFIGSVVPLLGEEPRDQISVGAMDLHTVKSGFLSPTSGGGKLSGQRSNVISGQFVIVRSPTTIGRCHQPQFLRSQIV